MTARKVQSTVEGLMRDALHCGAIWPGPRLTLIAIASRYDLSTGEARASVDELAELTGFAPHALHEHLRVLVAWNALQRGSGPECYIPRLPIRRARYGAIADAVAAEKRTVGRAQGAVATAEVPTPSPMEAA